MGTHYDREYKTQAARLVVEEGRTITQLADELNVSPKTLGRWARIYRDQTENGFIGSGNVHPDFKVQKDLEKKVKDLEEENAILKKAMHIFTKSPK
ncbi:transposase [Neobacillus sp. OS1-33]|uniref:transposase n=1 Tax=Neobacillus sp. OS1-33 TaxID=3070683 RepID=UPI0027DF22F8|nr:transposase [Neobacillus sp. OS1-33]WML28337.1 transposase [Neobacillus sp. OS1-33]